MLFLSYILLLLYTCSVLYKESSTTNLFLFLLFLPSYISMVGRRRTVIILGKFWPGKVSMRRCPSRKGLKEGREGAAWDLE